jgi:hypothetical protein
MPKLLFRWSIAIFWLLGQASIAHGQKLEVAAEQFALKITEHSAAPTAVSINFQNHSSLGTQNVNVARSALLQALQGHGWRLRKPEDADARLTITFAENFSVYVWTAQIEEAGTRDVVFFELPRPAAGARPAYGSQIVLSRSLLIAADHPLVDATLLEGKLTEGAHLLALGASTLDLYQFQSAQWKLVQTQPLGRVHNSRDLRGRIVPDTGTAFDAFLPGTHCSGVVTATLSVACRDSDDPWPLADDHRTLAFYAVNRNYFTGVLAGNTNQSTNGEQFYSAALLNGATVYAGIDGHARLLQAGRRPTIVNRNWGSELAALQTSCESDLMLASDAGDFTQPDSLSAWRVAGGETIAASDPIPFGGPIVSLKSSADRQQAIAITSSPTGRYEAYFVTARCGL